MYQSDSDQYHSGGGSSGPTLEVRQRRAHKKSRKGCKACKEQRKKCDERTPRCSRCNRLDQPCIYPSSRQRPPSPLPLPTPAQTTTSTPNPIASPTTSSLTLEVPTHRYRSRSFGATPSPHSDTELFPNLNSLHSPLLSEPTTPPPIPVLGPAELELLGHFLEHVSQQKVTEAVSHYAWRVGIPNLAFRSPPLMHTILSLAALCLCFDSGCMLDPSIPSYEQIDLISRRLDAAMSHHAQAVSSTLAGLADGRLVTEPDAAIINAHLMLIYSVASYRVQHWIYEARAGLGEEVEPPVLLSWMGLVRTASTAVIGLMRSREGSSPVLQMSELDIDVYAYAEAQDEATTLIAPLASHAFYPFLRTTAPRALEGLTRRVEAALRMNLPTASTTACIAALTGLVRIRAGVLCSPGAPCGECINPRGEDEQAGLPGMDGIPEWIRACILPREEIGTPHRGMVRLIIGWVPRLAQEFVDLLESAVNDVPGFGGELPQWSVEQRIAVDIFGHWLVFVILLSEVWWVGTLGKEELRRLVDLWDRRMGTCEWWPREMLRAADLQM